jgi:hypothetical protein
MRHRGTLGGLTGGVALLVSVGVASAQAPASGSRTSSSLEVPEAYRPPPGMCRVWLRNVPAMQQPAPTDCRSAWRTKPSDASVVSGPEVKRTSSSIPRGWRSDATGRQDEEPVRGADSCGDDNRDGICNQPFVTPSDPCVDGTRDARCAEAAGATLPMMWSAVLWIEGQRPADLVRWFGGQNLAARFVMPARGGAPDRVQWFDQDNRVVQVWLDRNGDGRADRVEVYSREGVRVRVYGQ